MPELITAMYHSKPICIFELLDTNGQYMEEVRSEYRSASQAGELICPECHGELELCAGVIIPPYFNSFKYQKERMAQQLLEYINQRK